MQNMLRSVQTITQLILVLSFLLFGNIGPAAAKAVSLEEVLRSAEEYDGKRVEIEGEAIGEILKGDHGYWVNISTGRPAIGVFSRRREVFEPINYWGRYAEKGDWVRVKGVFYRTCPLSGTAAVYLEDLAVIQEGRQEKIAVSLPKKQLGLLSFIICLISAAIYLIKLKLWKRNSKP